MGSSDALVVMGGDGTLHHALPSILGARVPFTFAPFGAENLFAREFGHRPTMDALRRALASAPRSIDAAEVTGRPFLLMAGVGPDAGIVARVAAARRGPISHLTYVPAMIAEARRPSLPALTVRAEGRTLVEGRRGFAVVANSRHYAVGLDPARPARIDDGRLDVVFMPCETRAALARWAVLCRLGRQLDDPNAVHAAAEEVTLEAGPGGDPPVQIDGEPGPGGLAFPLTVRVLPRALRVLTP